MKYQFRLPDIFLMLPFTTIHTCGINIIWYRRVFNHARQSVLNGYVEWKIIDDERNGFKYLKSAVTQKKMAILIYYQTILFVTEADFLAHITVAKAQMIVSIYLTFYMRC